MNLDIIAQLVQILKDAPELGAIEVRRGLFGFWSTVRVSKAGHAANTGAGSEHLVVTGSAPSSGSLVPAALGGGRSTSRPNQGLRRT